MAPPLSPQLAGNVLPASPRSSSGSQRPSIMKRNSSQGIMRTTVRSPGSEVDLQPLRHAVRPKGHARVVLPRNHSSGRNLAKLARQTAAGEANNMRLHTRTRSHEGDTEIRLPGSLDESDIRPPPMRRNLTSQNLPRNASHTKLKKNLSHGHLQRLGTAKDLAPLTSTRHKTPLSPALKGRSKRPKSLDLEKDLHTREVELAMKQEQDRKDLTNNNKRVGFRVGSADDDEESEQMPNMEGSGLDEGEWTEESASVSPYSTRANTANNSRRASMQHDRPPDKSSLSKVSHVHEASTTAPADTQEEDSNSSEESTDQEDVVTGTKQATPVAPPAITRSPLHAAKEHPNPTTQLLRRNSNQLPAPAMISNVTALDDGRSSKASPAGSLQSTNLPQEDELVSRFVPSTSNGSGTTTNMQNTPKSGSFHHTPSEDELHNSHREKHGFALGPVSPGSTVSGSSGAATPAMGRSRMELKLLQEKALADLESAVERGPMVPAHVYDRRNESLKSYLHLTALNQSGLGGTSTPLPLGPEIFQGRFKAVNTELKVVQKFRSPVAESIARLQATQGSKLNAQRQSSQKQTAGLRTSKSATTLPIRGTPRNEGSSLSTSTSPSRAEELATTTKHALASSRNTVGMKPHRRAVSRGVSFAGMDVAKDLERDTEDMTLDDVAKEMWDSVLN